MMSGKWTAIERLDPAPGVAVMTGTGYWLDGKFHPTRDGSRNGQDPQGLGSRRPGPVGMARKPSFFNRIRDSWGGGRG